METTDKLVARWESRSGKHYVDVFEYASGLGFYYQAHGAGGYGYPTLEAIVKELERPIPPQFGAGRRRVDDFQPDANKTPMVRVK